MADPQGQKQQEEDVGLLFFDWAEAIELGDLPIAHDHGELIIWIGHFPL